MEKVKEKVEMMTPFSNGTEAMCWMERNCDCCALAYHPTKDGEWPTDKTMRQYCRDGRECPMKYAIDFAHITGEMPLDMAQRTGYDSLVDPRMPYKCKAWKDRGDGGNPRGPKQPKPIPKNQLVMSFEFSDIAQNHKPAKKLAEVTL